VPTDTQVNVRVESLADGTEAAERDPRDATQLDPADRVLRDACSSGDVALAEALPAAQGADRAAESDHVHARTLRQRPYRPLHV